MNRIVLVLCVLLDSVILFEGKELQNCSSKLLNVCPISSVCSEISADGQDGQCNCRPGSEFNPNYIDVQDYCVPTKVLDENAPNHTNNKDDTESNLIDRMPNDGIKTVPQLPGAHHVVAGILIPILFVFIVIGSVFMYKKLHITHRVRNIRRTRRNRPFYEDVMLANNDNDDPPLI